MTSRHRSRARAPAPSRPVVRRRATAPPARRSRGSGRASGPRTVVVPPRTRGGRPPAGPVQPGSRRRMAFLAARGRRGARRVRRAPGLRPGAARGEHRRAGARRAAHLDHRCSAGAARSRTPTASPLATSVERYDISVNQKLVANFQRHAEPARSRTVPPASPRCSRPLLGMNAAELGGTLVGDRQFVYIRKGVLPEVAREVRKLGLQRRQRRPGRRARLPERHARRERHRLRQLQRRRAGRASRRRSTSA